MYTNYLYTMWDRTRTWDGNWVGLYKMIFISSSTHILSHSYMCLTFSTCFSAYYYRSCCAKVVFVLCPLNRAFSVLFQVQLELSRPVVVVSVRLHVYSPHTDKYSNRESLCESLIHSSLFLTSSSRFVSLLSLSHILANYYSQFTQFSIVCVAFPVLLVRHWD